jgi:copper(I)-binding protein
MKLAVALLIAASVPFAAGADVAVAEPWARASILASRPGAAYLTLSSDTDDRLLFVSTPVAGQVMIHAAETDASGVNRMTHLETLDLPAGKTVTFFPGSMHLLLTGLADKLEEGASFPLTLTFEVTGDVTVEVPVLGIAASGPREVEN